MGGQECMQSRQDYMPAVRIEAEGETARRTDKEVRSCMGFCREMRRGVLAWQSDENVCVICRHAEYCSGLAARWGELQ